ncbi:MAG: YfhO family protein [Lachnospiraceae bacterium]|nr:YfhO family protein [Lachnospiraceae bacterium]
MNIVEVSDAIFVKGIKNKYVIYSILYWGIIGVLLYRISALGLCTIGTSDAIAQHYPAMSYIRRLWKECFRALFTGEHYTFPMVDFTVGMGESTISALNYYGLGDPFYLLTMLSSQENLPYFYSVFFYFRVYIGGIAFMAFSSELSCEKSKAAYIAGAFVYSFTGFTLLSNAHIIFVHAMFYIPLMMLGAEKSMNNKRKGLLCAAVFGFGLSGFYFLYIGSVSLAVYVVYRLIVQKSTLKSAVIKIGSLIVEYFIGMGLSAIILLPSLIGFFLSGRGAHPELNKIMPLTEVLHLLTNIFLPSYDSIQTLSVCTIGIVVTICVIFAQNRKQEKINLALLFLLAIIPFVSYLMSGFGAVYDRWEIVLDMYIAFLVVDMFDELKSITIYQKSAVIMVCFILYVLGRKQDLFDYYQFEETFHAYVVISATLVIVVPLLNKVIKKHSHIGTYVLLFAVLFTINTNWKTTARDNDIVYLRERNAVAELIENDEQDTFYRIDYERAFAEPRLQMNFSMSRGYNGTMQYFSITNPYYVESFRKWDIASASYNVYGLDQRTVLETMCAVRYFVVRTEFASIVPFGFEYVRSTADGEWSLYENRNSLPIVYSYENVCDIALYNKMNGLEKQTVMLRAAAVEGYGGTLTYLIPDNNDLIEGDYIISDENGQLIDGDVIHVEAGNTLILTTQLQGGCENCLLFTGDNQFGVEISIEEGYTKRGIPNPPAIVNLGTALSDQLIKIRFTFSGAVDLNRKDVHIIYHDLSKYGQYIDGLKKDTENRFAVTTNNICGDVNLESNKLLCFSVPFAEGWHAAIDGETVKIYLVNDLFMGIEVPKGQHEIELYYITPGIRVGAVISVMSLIIVVVYFLLDRFKMRKNELKTPHKR